MSVILEAFGRNFIRISYLLKSQNAAPDIQSSDIPSDDTVLPTDPLNTEHSSSYLKAY